MSKTSLFDSKPLKLLISVGGIYTTYIYYGLIMERLFKQDYSGLDREKGTYETFKFGFATSLFQNIFSFILAAFVNRNEPKSNVPLKSQITQSSLTFFSVFLSSQALNYVSFPVQAIMKSSKIISILIVSLFFRSKAKHSKSQYFCGFLITSGIILFNFAQSSGKHSSESDTSLIGVGILVVSLICDGLLGVKQEETKKEYKPSAWELMEFFNKWGIVICFAVALLSGQFLNFIEYVKTYPGVLTDLVLLSFLGTVGQIFIYYTLSNFSSLVLSIITTTRKFFTVLFSILIYNHPITSFQWVSIGLVFTGVFLEMLEGKKKHSVTSQKKADPPQETKQSMLQSNSTVKTSKTQSQITQRR